MKVTTGRDFLAALQQAGCLPPNTFRVVFDASFEDVVHVYYECFGDSALLTVDTVEAIKGSLTVHIEDLSDQ
jgi:hypothetical protein